MKRIQAQVLGAIAILVGGVLVAIAYAAYMKPNYNVDDKKVADGEYTRTLSCAIDKGKYVAVNIYTNENWTDPEGEGSIYTLVTLAVEQTIKGETKDVVNIRVAGGEVNGRKLWVEDAPSFQLGERAVVFSNKGDATFTVVGGLQGKFTIDENDMVSGNTPLAEFIDQIRDVLARL